MPIDEVFFNFSSRCNMRCNFCYVPFRHHELDVALVDRIATRLSELEFKRIVISGGDPFLHSNLVRLLRQFCTRGHEVHVDSNFKSAPIDLVNQLRTADISVSFGIPLDGSNDQVQAQMRGEAGHFQVACYWIDSLIAAGYRVKVNSVVSALNIEDLDALEEILIALGVTNWSLYQFWPMEKGLLNARKHSIDPSEFAAAVSAIQSRSSIAIGGGDIATRKDKYLFVRTDGDAYTVDPEDHHVYHDLGSIFDPAVLERWSLLRTGRM